MNYYPLSPVQFIDFVQTLGVFLHPQSGNIPFSVYLDENTDLELLKKAVDIELERNDSMRLRFRIRGLALRQCFPSEKDIGEIPFDDFSGKTQDEFMEYIRIQNTIPLRPLKNETFRIRFFRAPDGRYGIYGTFLHLAMDSIGIFVFYRDLIEVYKALRDGTDLPKPLYSFEEILQKDTKLMKDKARHKKHSDFYREYLKREKPSFFAGVDRMKDLDRIRKRVHKPNYGGVPIVHPFNDASSTVKCHVDKETVDAMTEFCKARRIPLQVLFQLGIRTHLSKVNEETDDVTFFITHGRRATLADMNSGGSRAVAHVIRTDFGKEMTFSDALSEMNIHNMKIYKHPDYSSLSEYFDLARGDGRFLLYSSICMLFTFFPREMFTFPEGINCEFFGTGTGHFIYPQYTLIMPNLNDGGYDCYYEHQTRSITDEDVLLMHENLLKTAKAGIENPDITLGEILENIL